MLINAHARVPAHTYVDTLPQPCGAPSFIPLSLPHPSAGEGSRGGSLERDQGLLTEGVSDSYILGIGHLSLHPSGPYPT